jgi:hypothetical protein
MAAAIQADMPYVATQPLDRWVGAANSDQSDSRAAGHEAAAGALEGSDAKLMIVFASDSHDLGELVAGIREEAEARCGAPVPLIGCSTAGEIATNGPGESGVVVTALGGDGFSAAIGRAEDVSLRLREAGAEAASCMSDVEHDGHRVLLMLADGLAGDQQEIVRGAYGEVGAAVPLVGGCAGDDLKMKATHQLFNDEVLTNAVVAAALSSDSPMGIGVRHGWRTVGEPMLVTRSEGNRVIAIDDRPALDVYLERLAPPDDARNDAAAFTNFAQTHPLGLARRSGEEAVRFVGEADFEERSLVCIAEVPQGGMTWFMEGDHDSVLDATDAACADAFDGLEGLPPLGVLAFDCIARRGVLGDEGVRVEVDRVATKAGGAPVAGFYTYGEFARTHGVSGFHNQTLVVLALS